MAMKSVEKELINDMLLVYNDFISSIPHIYIYIYIYTMVYI